MPLRLGDHGRILETVEADAGVLAGRSKHFRLLVVGGGSHSKYSPGLAIFIDLAAAGLPPYFFFVDLAAAIHRSRCNTRMIRASFLHVSAPLESRRDREQVSSSECTS